MYVCSITVSHIVVAVVNVHLATLYLGEHVHRSCCCGHVTLPGKRCKCYPLFICHAGFAPTFLPFCLSFAYFPAHLFFFKPGAPKI